jgi:hypothetical protein
MNCPCLEESRARPRPIPGREQRFGEATTTTGPTRALFKCAHDEGGGRGGINEGHGKGFSFPMPLFYIHTRIRFYYQFIAHSETGIFYQKLLHHTISSRFQMLT